MSIFRHSIAARLAIAGSVACLLLHTPRAANAQVDLELQPMIGYSWVNITGFNEAQFNESAERQATEAAQQRQDEALEAIAMGQLPSDLSITEGELQQGVSQALSDSAVPAKGEGLTLGAALQLKLLFFVLGARYAYTSTPNFGLHTLGADVGMRMGGTVSVYGRFGGGYALQSGLPEGFNSEGFYLGGSGGLEIRPTDSLSIGAGLDVDVLLLSTKSQIEAAINAGGGDLSTSTLSELDGSAVGYQIRPQVHLIWHFL